VDLRSGEARGKCVLESIGDGLVEDQAEGYAILDVDLDGLDIELEADAEVCE